MSKKKNNVSGIVYSTDPDFKAETNEPEEINTLPPAQQQLRVKLDTKQRAGKVVTLVDGFVGTTEDLEKLGKELKQNVVPVVAQRWADPDTGDYKEKVIKWLQDWGYKAK